MEWTYSTYYFNFRMLLLESLADHQIALFEIGGNQIFVSDTYHLEIERSRMSGIRSHLCPLRCGRITIRPLYQVENILHILWHFCHWDSALLSADALRIRLGVLTRYTSSQYWQRLSAHILTPLEILEEPQLTGLVIVPDIESRFSVFQFTDTLFPMIDVAESLSVEHTSTRETHEARLQLSDDLSKILSQTMTFVGILRHQAHHIYGYLFLSLRQEGKTGILAQFTFIFVCDDKLFSIGEIAKALGVTRRIILHYEERGLIEPDKRDDATNNRYYTIDTFTKLRSIRSLQNLGLTLDEIRDYYNDSTDLMPLIRRMEEMRDQLNLNIEKLYERAKVSSAQVKDLELPQQLIYRRTYRSDNVADKTVLLRNTALEAMRAHGTDITRRIYFIQFPIDRPAEVSFCVAVPPGSEGEYVETTAPMRAICIYHHGAYEELPAVGRQLLDYAKEHGLTPQGILRHTYLEGSPQHKDPAKFITQVILPIV